MSLAGARCLVTGATGFIGWHLVRRLVKEAAEVFCIVEPMVERAELEGIEGLSEIYVADLTGAVSVRRAVEAAKPTVVFHLAAVGVTEPAVDLLRAVKVNVEGTLNLLLALDGCFDLFINTGTCHEYGNSSVPLQESFPPAPATVYAASKVAAWHFCNLFFATRGWPIATLRLFSVYGPHQPPQALVPSVIISALKGQGLPMSSGDHVRDFIFIEDVIAGYLSVAKNPSSAGRTFNLCAGRGVSLRELVSTVESLAGPVDARFGSLLNRPGEALSVVGDNSLSREVLGWTPEITLEKGLRRTIEWHREVLQGH